MKKNNQVLPVLMAFLIVAGSLAVGFSSRASVQKQKSKPSCCIDAKKCTIQGGSSSDMIPDNLSRQFMTILFPSH